MKYGYGVDVGGTTLKIGWFREDGTLLKHWEIPTDRTEGGKNILSDLAAAIRRFEEEEGVLSEDVLGIGLGIPGPVVDGVVNKCVNLGWGVTPVEDELSALTGYTVRADNDANVAALGEMWQGGGKGHRNVVMVTLGTGVGGGIIVGGRVVSGAHGAGGEIGHIHIVDDEPETCGCGNHGCLEQYGSATGISRLAEQAGLGHIGAKEVFDRAKAGDDLALSVVDHACDLLGRGIAAACAVIDPEAVVLGGGVSRAGEFLRLRVEQSFMKYAFHACRETKICLAALGGEAGIYGNARLAMQERA